MSAARPAAVRLAVIAALVALLVGVATSPAQAADAGARPKPAAHAERWVERVRGLMGTRFFLKAQIRDAAQEKALDRALVRVDALERLWSPWIAGSDVARLNAAGGKSVTVEPETIALAERSLALCRQSGGVFDPTFFALNGLWDLRAEPFRPPTDEAIAERLRAVGCRHLVVDRAAGTLRLTHPQARVHFGANAKGTGLDAAAAVLRRAGIRDFVVDGGGDLVVEGSGPKGPWRVGVQDPSGPRGSHLGRLELRRVAVATSGDYERFRVVDGVRYHHLLDPRTGRPATAARQVTVVVPAGPLAGEQADALATALFVLGPQHGRAWLKRWQAGQKAAQRVRVVWVGADGRRTEVGGLPWMRKTSREPHPQR